MRRKTGIALCAFGVILAIFGVVWMTAIFPAMTKLPCEIDTVIHTQGTLMLGDLHTMSATTFDVIGTKKYEKWQNCTSSTTYVYENCTFVIAGTDIDIPQVAVRTKYAIDRKTMELQSEGEGEGYFGQPLEMNANETYDVWITGNPGTIELAYTGEDDVVDGLDVQIWKMGTPEEGLPFEEPAGKRAYQQITIWVEPATGTVVMSEATTKMTYMLPDPIGEFTVYEDHLKFTDDTREEMVSTAKDAKQMLILFKTVLPWLFIGLGIVLIVLGIFLALRSGQAKPNSESPEPSKS